MRCLWLARTLPYPIVSGDRLYTTKLAEACAANGAQIRFVGLHGGAEPPPTANIEWVTVPGEPRGQLAALFSPLPLVAARHRIPTYVEEAARQLARPAAWDAIVIDQYGMGWIMDLLPRAAEQRPVIVFVAHDHEETVMRSLWQKAAPVPHRKAFLFLNYLKTRAIERKTVAASDIVTAITAADAAQFRSDAPGTRVVSLEPGYSGPVVSSRAIGRDVPRKIVVFGSLVWSAKQENLRRFLAEADVPFAAAGIEIEIVGQVPDDFAAEIRARFKSARVIGFVDNPSTCFARARLGVLAEEIGGGFKMKILDYVFNRVPVLALDACLSGLAATVRAHLFSAPGLPELVRRAVALIDETEALTLAQDAAFDAARDLFDWNERGRTLLTAIGAREKAARSGIVPGSSHGTTPQNCERR